MDFLYRAVALTAAIAPGCLVATIIFAVGKRTLPNGVASVALASGLFAVFVSSAELLLAPAIATAPQASQALLTAFGQAAVPEELAKFAMLIAVVLRHYDADAARDPILAGAWVGLGFGVVENFFYVTDEVHGGLSMGLIRALTAVPFHVALGAIMGWCLQTQGLRRGWIAAIVLPTFLHGLYDWPLLVAQECKAQCGSANFWLICANAIPAAVTSLLLAGPIAARLRSAAVAKPQPVPRALRLGAAAVAGIFRYGALVLLPVAIVGALSADAHLLTLLVLTVFPLGFAELWRRTRPSLAGPAE